MQLEDQPALVASLISWAELIANEVQKYGRPLREPEIEIARRVGVLKFEAIRLKIGPVHLPQGDEFTYLREELGLPYQIAGLSLGYSILLAEEPKESAYIHLAHELRHTHQFEGTDGLQAFVVEYLRQLASGYESAPWEVDARDSASLLLK